MKYYYKNGPSMNGQSSVRDVKGPRGLPREERPRERLIMLGPEALSDQDLLSVILGSGIKGQNVRAMALDLLEKLDRKKCVPSVEDLRLIRGLGKSKSCAVAAMLEFGRRIWVTGRRVRHPRDIFNLVRHYADRRQERFICISLNGAHEVLAARIVTIGLVNRTIIHPREVFADPIRDRASSIAVAHNHPSGNVRPSMEDNDITKRLKVAANILGINFLDHLVFSDVKYFSYQQDGRIEEPESWQQEDSASRP